VFGLFACCYSLLLLLLQGSLRTALDHKLLIDRTTGLPALECVLFLAHDVACAMIHLHSEHLLHGDLKASNVSLGLLLSEIMRDSANAECAAVDRR
jgi:serine/threonine protein kinase